MMRHLVIPALLLALAPSAAAQGQESTTPQQGYERAAADVRQRLEESVAELSALEQEIMEEKLELARRLSELETRLLRLQVEYRDAAGERDGGLIALNRDRKTVEQLEQLTTYLDTQLGQYVREFEARLHIAEQARYRDLVETARLAPEAEGDPLDAFRAQAALVAASLDRLDEAVGGASFPGRALDSEGLVRDGTFVLVGPTALFRSDDGELVGTVEQLLNSAEPSAIAFLDPEDSSTAADLVKSSGGAYVFDPSLGNAHRVEATQETLLEHVKKGGPVMIPIFAMAGLALLVALYKWLALTFTRKPSRRRVVRLLEAVGRRDRESARREATAMPGPSGRMLAAGVEHIDEPRDLIEEVMYEFVLTTRLRVQRFLPFIAICAASAPLLGLLGTVTGIINTFKMITVFGSGDVKSLSGGISEALITTKFGLIVAVPALLLHAFLSRKARGVVADMERNGMAFTNQVMLSRSGAGASAADEEVDERTLVRDHVGAILRDLLAVDDGATVNGAAPTPGNAPAGSAPQPA